MLLPSCYNTDKKKKNTKYAAYDLNDPAKVLPADYILGLLADQDGCAWHYRTQKLSTVSGDQWQMTIDRKNNDKPHQKGNVVVTALEFNCNSNAGVWTSAKAAALLKEGTPNTGGTTEWQQMSREEKLEWAAAVHAVCDKDATHRGGAAPPRR